MTIQSVHAEFFFLLSTHYLLQREVDATAAVDYRFDSVGCIDVDIVGHLSFSFLLGVLVSPPGCSHLWDSKVQSRTVWLKTMVCVSRGFT